MSNPIPDAYLSPTEDPDTRRALLTFAFCDLAGSTERACQIGDTAWRALLQDYRARVRREVEHRGGREIGTAGDSFLVVFALPTAALRCAAGLLDAVAEMGMQLRIGIHTGECSVLEDDVVGIAVHAGARIMAAAEPGEVLASSTVRQLVAGSDLRFRHRGLRRLRGFAEPFELFSLDREVQPAVAVERGAAAGDGAGRAESGDEDGRTPVNLRVVPPMVPGYRPATPQPARHRRSTEDRRTA